MASGAEDGFEMESDEMRRLRVDTMAITDAMAMSANDPFRHYLDLETGEVTVVCLERMSLERPDPVEETIERDPDRFEPIPRVESRAEYLLMEEFVEGIAQDDIREMARFALQGRGAFARFRSVVFQYPDLREAWLARRDAWLIHQATLWLRDLGIEPEHVLPASASLPAPVPAPAAPAPMPLVRLLHVLLLGAPAVSAGDAVDGRFRRHAPARRPDEARKTFERLARELCEWRGVPWHKQLVGGKTVFELEDIRLEVRADGVEVTVVVPTEIVRAFARQ